MEPEGSLPHSQASATCPYPVPAQSSPHPTSWRSILILSTHLRLGPKEAHSLIYFNNFFRIYVCTFTVAKPLDLKLTYNNDACHTVSSKLQVLHTLTVAELVQNFLVKKFLAFSKTPCKSKAMHT